MTDQRVADVMTRQVVAVGLDTPFRDVVHALLEHALLAVPVVDPAGRPAGIVSGADAAAKREFRGGADAPLLLGNLRRWGRWRKAGAFTAAEAMTTPAPTVAATAPVHLALRRLADRRYAQLCAVDERGRLVGVLTHHDALRCYLRSDAEICSELEARLPGEIVLHVSDGTVTLTGTVQLRSSAIHAVRDARQMPGVVVVRDCLDYRIDDLHAHGL
ncbi:CBS domain-containing protein [Amycolatopsis benzoatilytica]|uniref:CBS domain-containing protein n=1 Tax=Amycolatopsis benzoatilytica TaxID=346045 RepID=UPI000368BB73|nr:CBS domain-containing protein [Amycolatopsis benzoatilytica]